MARITNWTKMDAGALWEAWRAQFEDDSEAVVTAVWIANRLVKARAQSTRRKFYSIKDAWIKRHQKHLVEGRKVRTEHLECNNCVNGKVVAVLNYELSWKQEEKLWRWMKNGFEGKPPEGVRIRWEQCPKCNGTGIYRRRWLYLHVFDIDGQRFCFHSRVKPRELSDKPGDDLESYGGQFMEAELTELALPVTGLIRVLAYVAAARWGMTLDKRSGIYYDSIA